MNARIVLGVALIAGIAACSGGTPVAPTVPTQPAARKALARLTISVPPRKHARGRHAHYISPATASLAYSIDGVAQTAVLLTTSNPDCQVAAPIGYLKCGITIAVAPGQHTFSFTTLDADGKTLSANTQVVSTIVAGAANTIAVTLGGIATSFAVYPPNVPQVTAVEGGGFAVYGKKALQFSIVPLDADHNAILGPGAPQPVVSAAPAGMTMQTPAPSSPNLWTFMSTYAPTDPSVAKVSSIAVSATPVPNSGGTTLSAAIPLSLYVPWIYETSEAGGNDNVVVTDEYGNPQSVAGGFPNLSSVNGIAYDPHNGFLYVENGGSANVTVYDLQGHQQTVAGSFQNGGPDQPDGIVFDPHDNWLYVTYSASGVAAFDEQGRMQTTSGGFPGLNGPLGIAYDGANQFLYVASAGGGAVIAYDEQGNQKALSGGFPNLSAPAGVAYDPINAFVYVGNTNYGGGSPGNITVYDAQGNQQTVSGSFSGLGQGPVSVAHDPHNDWFYVGDCSGTPLRAFDPNGNSQTLSGTTPTYVPGIAIVP